MNLSSLTPAKGSVKHSKRVGRGQGSGKGGTSTRGHKGAKARSGYSRKVGFEGGQMPLYRRVPKFGFKNINRVEYIGINIDVLNNLHETKNIENFDLEVLRQNGLLSGNNKVKILGRGELNAKINVTAHKFSESARKAIEEKGGTVSELDKKAE